MNSKHNSISTIKVLVVSFLGLFLLHSKSYSRECESSVEIQLKNIDGGFFRGENITLESKADGKIYALKSDSYGKVKFTLPCDTKFKVTISNYDDFNEIESPPGGSVTQILSYSANSKKKKLLFAMNDAEISKVDQTAMSLPDTIFISNSKMNIPRNEEHFFQLIVNVKNLEGLPLKRERIVLTGTKRNKSFKGTLDENGRILLYLPKGDHYSVNFVYNKNYTSVEHDYTKGIAKEDIGMTYIGTEEIERRKKEEALRIIAEEKRLKEEKERFAKECAERKITVEEGYRLELRKNASGTLDTVIISVMSRNKWPNKLIVCDLTGSMNPYATQLSIWYQLNYKKEQALQFVFFNDGDGMPDEKKKIGETGGIYYSPAIRYDSLARLMAHVSSHGDGGDCPENNMEALIKGVKMAKPFKELVTIVDNHSPVKDIELLKSFTQPVHIILCGASNGNVLKDYLQIAWKTHGTIHTIEEDITSIAKMSEGQELKIENITYRIMGGEFVRISK